jgi:DNA-binding transcriptional regulator YhcF (GntR family)
MLTVGIDRSLDVPVYEQVADQLRALVASGALPAGTILPPVRRLAGDLGVSLNTVARAYRLLTDEGFVRSRSRSRVEVLAPAERIEGAPSGELLDQLRATLARLRQAGMSTGELLRVVNREVGALGAAGEERNDG